MIRVLIADDHPLTRDALRMYLENAPDIEVIAEATEGAEAFDCVREFDPDVVLMDVSMPGGNGIDATRRIVADNPNTKVIVLSALETASGAIEALRAGAKGYFSKRASSAEIIAAVRDSDADALMFSADMASKFFVEVRTDAGVREELLAAAATVLEVPPRELAVLKLLSRGMTNSAIANELFLSIGTVKTYVYRLRDRLNAEDRLDTVIRAFRLGLVEPPSFNGRAEESEGIK